MALFIQCFAASANPPIIENIIKINIIGRRVKGKGVFITLVNNTDLTNFKVNNWLEMKKGKYLQKGKFKIVTI